jgi:hypothetical protein
MRHGTWPNAGKRCHGQHKKTCSESWFESAKQTSPRLTTIAQSSTEDITGGGDTEHAQSETWVEWIQRPKEISEHLACKLGVSDGVHTHNGGYTFVGRARNPQGRQSMGLPDPRSRSAVSGRKAARPNLGLTRSRISSYQDFSLTVRS